MVRRHNEIEDLYPELASGDAPTQKVGADLSPAFGKIVHPLPMLSLENAFSADDVEKFLQSVRGLLGKTPADRLVISAEPKIDGLSLSLRYENGELVSAATRGPGAAGDAFTRTDKTIRPEARR